MLALDNGPLHQHPDLGLLSGLITAGVMRFPTVLIPYSKHAGIWQHKSVYFLYPLRAVLRQE